MYLFGFNMALRKRCGRLFKPIFFGSKETINVEYSICDGKTNILINGINLYL